MAGPLPVAAGVGRRPWLAGALGLAAGAWAGRGLAATEPQPPTPKPWPARQPTPPLALPTWQGGNWRLADARGQVVIINFWASWCVPCREEMPTLELLAQRLADQRVQVVTVNHRETDGALRRFIDDTGLGLPVLRDVDGAASKAWQVRIYPSTVVIARSGRPAFTVVGEVDWAGPTARGWLTPWL